VDTGIKNLSAVQYCTNYFSYTPDYGNCLCSIDCATHTANPGYDTYCIVPPPPPLGSCGAGPQCGQNNDPTGVNTVISQGG
jgi:hypothetical protein